MSIVSQCDTQYHHQLFQACQKKWTLSTSSNVCETCAWKYVKSNEQESTPDLTRWQDTETLGITSRHCQGWGSPALSSGMLQHRLAVDEFEAQWKITGTHENIFFYVWICLDKAPQCQKLKITINNRAEDRKAFMVFSAFFSIHHLGNICAAGPPQSQVLIPSDRGALRPTLVLSSKDMPNELNESDQWFFCPPPLHHNMVQETFPLLQHVHSCSFHLFPIGSKNRILDQCWAATSQRSPFPRFSKILWAKVAKVCEERVIFYLLLSNSDGLLRFPSSTYEMQGQVKPWNERTNLSSLFPM